MKKILIFLISLISFSAQAQGYDAGLDTANIIIWGNSYVVGGGGYWASKIHEVYPNATVAAMGQNGWTTAGMNQLLVSNDSTNFLNPRSHFIQGKRNICVIVEGTNDPRSGSADDAYNRYVSLSQTMRSTYNWETIVSSVIVPAAKRQVIQGEDFDFTFPNKIWYMDSLIYKNYATFSDGLLDWAGSPHGNDPFNLTYFASDGLHPISPYYLEDIGPALILSLQQLGHGKPTYPVINRPYFGTSTASSGQISVSHYTDASATGYQFDYSLDGGLSWTPKGNYSSNPAVITGLTNGLSYRFRAKSVTSSKEGQYAFSQVFLMAGTPPIKPVTIIDSISTVSGERTAGSLYTGSNWIFKIVHAKNFNGQDFEFSENGGSTWTSAGDWYKNASTDSMACWSYVSSPKPMQVRLKAQGTSITSDPLPFKNTYVPPAPIVDTNKSLKYKNTSSSIHYNSSAQPFRLIYKQVSGDVSITNVRQNSTSIDVFFNADGSNMNLESSTDGGTTWTNQVVSTSPYNLAVSPSTPVRLRIARVSNPTAKSTLKDYVTSGVKTGKTLITDYGDSNTKDCNSQCKDSTMADQLTWTLNSSNYTLPVINKGQGGETFGDRADDGSWIGVDGRIWYKNNNYDGTNTYVPSISTNIAIAAFQTNDIGTIHRSWQACLHAMREFGKDWTHAGYVFIPAMAAIAYSSDDGYGIMNTIVKANPDTVLASTCVSFYDNDTLNVYGAGGNFLPYRDALHYFTPATIIQARLFKPVLDSISALIRVIPPTLPSLSWNSGTQNISFTPSTGFIATDYEYTANWDGVNGMMSTWQNCSSNTINVTSTVASGAFAVRVHYNKYNPPAIVRTNSTQLN